MNKQELNKLLVVSIAKNDLDTLKLCVEHGADVNTFEIEDKLYNPLYCCLVAKNARAFDYLAKHGADVTQRLGNKELSLLYCCCKEENINIGILGLILQYGGVVDISYAPKGCQSPKDIVKSTNNVVIKDYFDRAINKTIATNEANRRK